MSFSAVLDACVLLPYQLADSFGKTPNQAARRVSQMRCTFPYAAVWDYQALIPSMATIRRISLYWLLLSAAAAAVIVTANPCGRGPEQVRLPRIRAGTVRHRSRASRRLPARPTRSVPRSDTWLSHRAAGRLQQSEAFPRRVHSVSSTHRSQVRGSSSIRGNRHAAARRTALDPRGGIGRSPPTHLRVHSEGESAPGDALLRDDHRSDAIRSTSMTARRATFGRP